MRCGAGLIGEPACIAHLQADPFGRMGELVGSLRERGRRALRGTGASGEGVGALANRGERSRRSLSTARNRTRRALELADHSAKFKLEQFEDLPCGIGVIRIGSLKGGRERFSLRFDFQSSTFRR